MGGLLLAGPPGAGKTTVARCIADRLGRQFVDLDALIEARCHRTPAQILEQDGEQRFRAQECDALEALGPAGVVVALGGGALTSARTRHAARRLGAVVRLDVDQEVLEDRLRFDGTPRPLLAGGLGDLLEARRASYAAVDLVVDGRGSPDEVAERIEEATLGLSVVRARLLEAESRVVIGRGLLPAVVGAVAHLEPSRPVLLLMDRGIPDATRRRVETELRSLFEVCAAEVDGGEAAKRWDVLGDLLDRALRAGCGRQSVVVALGGGAVLDAGNLAAHLLGRGARSVLVPTTLLAQVDASIGGKCAVNHAGARNSVGAFHPPEEVVVDLDHLESLDPAEYRAGLAELIKVALIGLPEVFEQLEAGRIVDPELVAAAVECKAKVVARDPLERGERRRLNLGHTLGHALEAASGFTLRHGEAVAIGLVAAARASRGRGLRDEQLPGRIEALLSERGLPTSAEPELLSAARSHLASDKKGDRDGVEWVRIRALGDVDTQRLPWSELEGALMGDSR